MNTLQTILNDLISPTSQKQYILNDNNQTFVTPGGQVVTLANAQLVALTAHEPDAGARQVYQYFKFIRDRAVLPVTATNDSSKLLSAKQQEEIIKECITNAFSIPLQPTTYEVLSDRIHRDYSFYHRNNSARYPADIRQLSLDSLRDFVRMRVDAWKYEIVHHVNKEGTLPTFMEDMDSSLVETIFSMPVEAKAQELSLQKMFNSGKLKTASGLLYRGGSLHEPDKAKRIKMGQPCFDIHVVNRSAAVYGRGLYVSPMLSVATKYASLGTLGVILEITVNQDSELMLFHDPYNVKLTTSLLQGIQSINSPIHFASTLPPHNYSFASTQGLPNSTTVSFSSGGNIAGIKVNISNGTVSFAQPFMSNRPTWFGSVHPQPAHIIGTGPLPILPLGGPPGQQPAPVPASNDRSSIQTDIVPIINDVPHPLVGCIKCAHNIYLIVNPRFVKKIKVLDNELRTKIDLNFSAQEIITHKLVPKLTPPPHLSQQSQQIATQLIDPLTLQSSNAIVFLVEKKLPFEIASQRNRETEVKCYAQAEPNRWLRVKPQFNQYSAGPISSKPFVISYTRSSSSAKASSQ